MRPHVGRDAKPGYDWQALRAFRPMCPFFEKLRKSFRPIRLRETQQHLFCIHSFLICSPFRLIYICETQLIYYPRTEAGKQS